MGTAYLWGQGGGGLDADGATAAPGDVVAPYTFIGAGSDELQTGEVEDVTQDLTIPINGKVMIPAGFHDGTGKAKQNLTNQGTKNYTLSANGKVTIPAGWHSGSGKVSQSIPVFNGGTYTPTAAGQSIDTAGEDVGDRGGVYAAGDGLHALQGRDILWMVEGRTNQKRSAYAVSVCDIFIPEQQCERARRDNESKAESASVLLRWQHER